MMVAIPFVASWMKASFAGCDKGVPDRVTDFSTQLFLSGITDSREFIGHGARTESNLCGRFSGTHSAKAQPSAAGAFGECSPASCSSGPGSSSAPREFQPVLYDWPKIRKFN
jgi:hypothetical protein